MKMRKRIYYNAQQRAIIWERYQQGDSLHDIARFFDRFHSSIQGIIAKAGCIKSQEKTRSVLCLTPQEREEISRGSSSQLSIRQIAEQLNRSSSTVPREVNRNGGRKLYRANKADAAAWERAKRPKPCKLLLNKALAKLVAMKLYRSWSPQQIASWLMRTYSNKDLHVSHEKYIKRSMSKRDGHWERYLIQGSGNSHIATLVERHSRYVMLVKVGSNRTAAVIDALIKQSKKLTEGLYKTLTLDRVCEMSNHKDFTLVTDTQVFFCDPKSPWQRGSNENTNRLLRQYFPKGTDLIALISFIRIFAN